MDKRDEILEIIKKRLLNVPLHEEKRIVLAVDCVDKLVDHLMEWHESRLAPLRKVWGNLSENDIIYLPTPLKEAIQQVLGETEEGGEG